MGYNSLFELTGKQSGIVAFDGNAFITNWKDYKGLPETFLTPSGPASLGTAFPKKSDIVFELQSQEVFPDGLEALNKYCMNMAVACMIKGLQPRDLEGKSGQVIKATGVENGKKKDVTVLIFDDWK